MTLPRVRLRTWTLLVLISAIVSAWGVWGWKLMPVYRLKAQSHAAHEMNYQLTLRQLQTLPLPVTGPETTV